MKEVQNLYDKIMSNPEDTRNVNVLEVLEDYFGAEAVRQWLENQK